jgi:hypothetical protein
VLAKEIAAVVVAPDESTSSHTVAARKPLLRKCPSPLCRLEDAEESTTAKEAFGLEFQRYCARIVHFALPPTWMVLGICDNQMASQRPVAGENAKRDCLDDALKIEGN